MRRRAFWTPVAVVLAGLWGACLGVLHLSGDVWFLDRVEATMADLRTQLRGARTPPAPIVIVAIDDETVRIEGGYPLKRATLARLVDAIVMSGATALGIDILLVDAGIAADDQALAQALSDSPAVIAAAGVFAGEKQWIAPDADDLASGVPQAERFLLPLDIFAAAAAVGMVNVATDPTGTPRFVPMLLGAGGQLQAALPLRVAAMALGADPEVAPDLVVLGGRTIHTDRAGLLPINFYGPRGAVRTLSAADVLAGGADRASLLGHIVVIGSTVTGGGDVFPTPFDPVMPGAEVIATSIANLVAGDGLLRNRTVRLADAATCILLPMLLVALVAWRRSAVGLAAIVAVLLVWAGMNVAAFASNVWLSASLPLAAALPPLALFGAAQLWLNRARATRFAAQSELLQRVQAPGLGAWLAENRDFLAQPLETTASVVFIDLSAFTGLSETLGPAATRDILSGFHTLVDDTVTECGGIVTSFMGDGAMILFGLPEPGPGDACKAADCSVRLATRSRFWLAAQPQSVSARLGFKIGAHHGPIVASRMGGAAHQHLAATGDTVNVASRLMEVAAAHGVEVALSDDLLRAAGPHCEPFASGSITGPIDATIRGRAGSLPVWLWKAEVEARVSGPGA